jgi:Leucine-rich repeat (LRR) protein
MSNDYIIENGTYDKKLVLISQWNSKISKFMDKNKIHELELNYSRGWNVEDISFLKEVPFLEVLIFISHQINDISPMYKLHALKKISLNEYSKNEIDFSQFPELEDCYLEWRPKAKSIFKSKSLKKIYIQNYKSKKIDDFSELKQLEELTLGNSPIEDLSGLRGLINLRKLCLYLFHKLTSLNGIEFLNNLNELEINNSKKFYEINEIGELINLKKLQLCTDGKIKSLNPLKKLKKIESFFFYEDTNIEDGDLTNLWEMDNLKDISFQNRKHYSHTREQFFKKLGIKG